MSEEKKSKTKTDILKQLSNLIITLDESIPLLTAIYQALSPDTEKEEK